MTREELDTLWDKSVNESIKAGDSYARYRYAEYVAKAALAEPEQPQKARPDFLAGYDAGLADGRRIAALAEEKQKPEPVAWMVYTLDGKSVCVTDNPADFTGHHRALPLYTAPPAAALAEPEKGNCADGSCNCCWTDKPDAKREPATVEQIDEEYIGPVIDARWHDFEAGFRAAERFHGITKEDA
jgi:hypothetical protein